MGILQTLVKAAGSVSEKVEGMAVSVEVTAKLQRTDGWRGYERHSLLCGLAARAKDRSIRPREERVAGHRRDYNRRPFLQP